MNPTGLEQQAEQKWDDASMPARASFFAPGAVHAVNLSDMLANSATQVLQRMAATHAPSPPTPLDAGFVSVIFTLRREVVHEQPCVGE